ncbi:DUF2723 domain-containing protein [Rhodocytophaga aerolata]|uniref:DUF2723 domain-containing protein n=1 Tax=Rhodocytophaga aerolata TaxID=455078 RepID=A0ABT8RAL1_9BACT|nr:DUF2723 domain-containing protein [Rhodocytophaga aerolata]MDO1449136.1 DUF2723 domain-containing protein [Rhodocytophaga aerolata]
MLSFNRLNNLTGWAVFAVASLVYVATVEPTASLWDCGEFIASAFKLEVGHPPGAPFFLLLGRMFSFLAGSDVSKVAYWINILSALSSAFTILFLFWTITLLARKFLPVPQQPTLPQTVSVLAAGAVGALAYAFTDSFWFSAVEAEVYALSSLLTAFVVWAMLRWENTQTESAANRWLNLIAYVIGLSVGTHLLNLVALPVLAFIYYFKKYKPSLLGGVLTLGVGLLLIGLLMVGMRTGLPSLAGKFDIFFVNTLGMPFGSGVICFALICLGALVYGIWYSIKHGKSMLNTALLAITFVLIGYSSYSVILIRAQYNTPVNLNNPDDVASFMNYLNMKQYGSGRPLLYGPYFTAPLIDQEQGAPEYVKRNNEYEILDHDLVNVYEPTQMTLLPRIYSHDPNHVALYRQMLGLREGQKPTFGDNLRFLFSHQLGHMYGRYFMWNFAGKESDQEGAGWMASLTSAKDLPSEMTRNKAHNRLYMLPLLLGLAGMIYQYIKNKQHFLLVGLLFFMTGIALVLYLNSPPVEPRERDYIYVGSFYAFAIWIGFGVLALVDLLSKVSKSSFSAPVLAGALGAMVPVMLVTQNWDDHNRSGRYFALDSARNLLNSCAPNAILFTNGDNDTYPLWYAQEVEGIRKDVRVCVTQFMGTDWYIDQLKRKTYESEALPISMQEKNYIASTNNQIIYYENPNIKGAINLQDYIRLIREDYEGLKVALQSGEKLSILPTNRLFLPINKQTVLQKGMVSEDMQELIPDSMEINLDKNHLFKDDLIFLDILANNNWERPIYFSSLFTAAKYHLEEYTQIEGFACRLLPVKVPGSQGFVNSEIMYNNLMNKYAWRGLDSQTTYHDEVHRNYISNWGRLSFLQLSTQLLNEGQQEKAKEVLLRSLNVMPDETIPYDRICSLYVAPLLKVGEEKKALEIAQTMAKRADENLAYYYQEGKYDAQAIQNNLVVLNQLAVSLGEQKHKDAQQYQALFDKRYTQFQTN